jgi:hypothetical protein
MADFVQFLNYGEDLLPHPGTERPAIVHYDKTKFVGQNDA